MASLPTTLMAKYASISIINCNLQIENEEALKPAFQKLEPFVQNYSNSQDFKDKVQKIEQESHAKAENLVLKVTTDKTDTTALSKEEENAKNLYNTIKTNYNKLLVPRTHTPEQYFKNILYDKIRMKTLEDEIISDLEPKLLKEAEKQGLEKLNARSGGDRTTYCFYGAPASGKGTSVAMRRSEALKGGKNWADIVKINTDSHRDFVRNDTPTDKAEYKTQLNHHESAFISNMSYHLYDKKVSEDKAPDMLIDTIMPNQARLDVALQNGGKTLIDVITIPAEKCVERAFQRAESGAQGFVPI